MWLNKGIKSNHNEYQAALELRLDPSTSPFSGNACRRTSAPPELQASLKQLRANVVRHRLIGHPQISSIGIQNPASLVELLGELLQLLRSPAIPCACQLLFELGNTRVEAIDLGPGSVTHYFPPWGSVLVDLRLLEHGAMLEHGGRTGPCNLRIHGECFVPRDHFGQLLDDLE